MRTRTLPIAALLALAVLAGCGSTDDATPVACLNGPNAYLRALRDAPGEARLAADTPISSCLAENQQAGDLADVGNKMLEAATTLNGEAREDPGGSANLQLGYLIGAAQRGAEKTDGIHAELVRRLTAAAGYSPEHETLGQSFERAYRRGYDAGLAGG